MMMFVLFCLPLLSLGDLQIPQLSVTTAYEMALLSKRVYDSPPENANPLEGQEGTEFGWWADKTIQGTGGAWSGEGDGFVMLARNEKEGKCAVVFQGTQPTNLSEWFRNLNVVPHCLDHDDYELPCKARDDYVHTGFMNLFMELLHDGHPDFDFGTHGANERYYKDWLQKCASRGDKILFTGHSLGAAMAVIGAMSLHKNYNQVLNPRYPTELIHVYTFGEPRVVSPEGECPSWLTDTKNHRRFVNVVKGFADLVTQLPPVGNSACVGGWALVTDHIDWRPVFHGEWEFPRISIIPGVGGYLGSVDLHDMGKYVWGLRERVTIRRDWWWRRAMGEGGIIAEYHNLIFTGGVVLGAAAVVGSLVALKKYMTEKVRTGTDERSYLIEDNNHYEA